MIGSILGVGAVVYVVRKYSKIKVIKKKLKCPIIKVRRRG